MAKGEEQDDEKREDWFEVMGLAWDATADDVKDGTYVLTGMGGWACGWAWVGGSLSVMHPPPIHPSFHPNPPQPPPQPRIHPHTAYKKLALKYHPDKNQGDPKAADRFMLVNKAKTFLSDDAKRTKLAEKKQRVRTHPPTHPPNHPPTHLPKSQQEANRDKRNKQRFAEMDAQRKRFKGDLESKEAAERARATAARQGGGGGGGGGDRGGGGINMHLLDELRKMGQQQREAEARRMEELLMRSNEAAAVAVEQRLEKEKEVGGWVGGWVVFCLSSIFFS